VELAVGSLCLLVPLALVGLVVLAAVTTARSRRRRTETLAGYAAQREWRFSPSGAGLERRFRGDPFGRGHSRRATNVIEGWHEGRAFLAFDYSYVSGTGDDATTYRCSVITMHLGAYLGESAAPVPMLQVAPQGALGRFFNGLFGRDLLVGDPVFDAAFQVRTDSPELAHDVLHRDLTTMLTTLQDRAWRLQDDSMLMFRQGQHAPAEIDAVLASMRAILDRVPTRVWARLRGESSQ
jgi:hypothetical protein